MKKFTIPLLMTTVLLAGLLIQRCSTTKPSEKVTRFTDSAMIDQKTGDLWLIEALQGKAMNHPSFAIWIEDAHGRFLRTIFITRSYATGIFNHQMVGDTIWLNESGPSYQPAALPVWTHRKDPEASKVNIPTPEQPYLDAYSGATPTGSFSMLTSLPRIEGTINLYMEVNQPWDWNDYWTTGKFPGNHAYAHSAQPSLILHSQISSGDTVVVANPVGYGDPKGESGKIFPEVETLTTAREIFESVRLIKQ